MRPLAIVCFVLACACGGRPAARFALPRRSAPDDVPHPSAPEATRPSQAPAPSAASWEPGHPPALVVFPSGRSELELAIGSSARVHAIGSFDALERPSALYAGDDWYEGPGQYHLIAEWDGASRREHVELPLALTEHVELVVISPALPEQLVVELLTRAEGLALTGGENGEVAFALHNGSERPVTGTGYPAGWFDGHLLRLTPSRRAIRASRSYCGTGAVETGPLLPGRAAESGPSPWAMSDHDRESPDPGAYVWVVPASGEGWRHTDARIDVDGMIGLVVRGQAAFATFVVP